MEATSMITKDYLNEALRLTANDRQNSYGDKSKNHCNIGALWSAYLGREITARDVSLMMALLKIARTKLGRHDDDDYIDGAAYIAIAGEIAHDNQDAQMDLFKENGS